MYAGIVAVLVGEESVDCFVESVLEVKLLHIISLRYDLRLVR